MRWTIIFPPDRLGRVWLSIVPRMDLLWCHFVAQNDIREYGPAGSRVWLLSPPSTRRPHSPPGHGQHGLHAAVQQPGHADDSGLGVLLWRPRRPEERPHHHD